MLRHQGNDKLIGSNRVDIMHGRAGDDILKGFGGEDNGLLGEKGNDELRGGSDRDALSGGPGKDMLNGGEGNDLYYYLEPGWGHDRITDTAIVDNDFRFGNALSFEFVPNIGDLTINLNPDNKPEVSNGDGTSTVSWEGPIIDNLASGDGDDKIVGNDADNSIRSESGDDKVFDGESDDVIDVRSPTSGEHDTVDCGGGTADSVAYDHGEDTVLPNCEDRLPV